MPCAQTIRTWLQSRWRGLLVLCIFGVIGTITFTWYHGSDYLWGIDANVPVNLKAFTYQYFYMWNDKAAPGFADPLKFPLLVPLGLLLQGWALLGLPFSGAAFQRSLLYILFVGAELGMYRLYRTMFPDLHQIGAIVAAVFYATNFFALLGEWAPLAFIVFEYAFFPLVLATFIRRCKAGRLRDAAIVALLWTLTLTPSYITVSLVLTDWGIVGLYVLFEILLNRSGGHWFRTIRFSFAVFSLWSLLNLFWIAPLAGYGSSQLANYGPSSNFLFQLNSAPLEDAFRMVGYFGLRTAFAGTLEYPWYPIFDSAPFVAIGCLLPILALLGFQLHRRRKETLFIAVLLTGGMFLVKGPNPPFGEINEALYSIPLISSAFRSTYVRFMELVSLGYAILIGMFLSHMAGLLPGLPTRDKVGQSPWKGVRRTARLAVVATLVVLVVGVYAWPLWTGTIYESAGITPSRRADFPPSYTSAADWLDAQPGIFSVLPVPYSTTNNVISYWWKNGSSGYLGVFPLQILGHRSILVGPGLPEILVTGILNGTIGDCAYLNLVNVRYIAVSLDANGPWAENETTYLAPRPGEFQGLLSNLDHCRQAQAFGPLVLYENTAWVPSTIRLSNDATGFLRDKPPLSLDSWNRSIAPNQAKESPDRYRAVVTTTGPTIAYLNLAFDPHWELWVNGVRLWDSAHFLAYGYMNAWRVNDTGALTLEFVYPEVFLDIGAYLSLGSLTAISALIAWESPLVRRAAYRWLAHRNPKKRWM